MGKPVATAPSLPPETVPLRIHRVVEGSTQLLRMGSPIVDGMMTHYIHPNSHYCPGDRQCPQTDHRKPCFWKGYVYAHLLLPDGRKWQPVVFEVTENLDVDMRYIYQPGQVWECFRPMRVGKKHFPVQGKLIEEKDPLPGARTQCVLGTLRRVYHAPGLVLGVKNPTPDRAMCEILESAAALFKMPNEPLSAPTPAEIEKMKEARKRLKGMMGNR